jgi:hypothetical protein
MNTAETYIARVTNDDPDAEQRFVLLVYDPEPRQVVSMSPELTEAEMREYLGESGMPRYAIDSELENARRFQVPALVRN